MLLSSLLPRCSVRTLQSFRSISTMNMFLHDVNKLPKKFQDYPSLCFCLMFVTCYWLIGDLFKPSAAVILLGASFQWSSSCALGGALPGLIDSDSLGQQNSSNQEPGLKSSTWPKKSNHWRFARNAEWGRWRERWCACVSWTDWSGDGRQVI